MTRFRRLYFSIFYFTHAHLCFLYVDDIDEGRFKDHDYDPWFQRIPLHEFKEFFHNLPCLQHLEISDE